MTDGPAEVAPAGPVTPSPGFIGPVSPPILPSGLFLTPPPDTSRLPGAPAVPTRPTNTGNTNQNAINQYFNYEASQWNRGGNSWPFKGAPPAPAPAPGDPAPSPTMPGAFIIQPVSTEAAHGSTFYGVGNTPFTGVVLTPYFDPAPFGWSGITFNTYYLGVFTSYSDLRN